MKFYQLNYDFDDPLNCSVYKYYRNYNNAKRAMDRLINQELTHKGAKKYACSSHKHFLNYVWVANNNNWTILNVTIAELRMED